MAIYGLVRFSRVISLDQKIRPVHWTVAAARGQSDQANSMSARVSTNRK